MTYKCLCGDSLELLKQYDDNTFDSVVTDPPYGLSFMGKKWDYDVPSVEMWKEVLRVLKPGGHLLSFGGSRTYHRMTVNVEDAGFEVRDQIMWIYGSGFPKSHNIGKAYAKNNYGENPHEGWGTALKPAHEPIVLARKPISEGTVLDNVIKWGTGGLNIDECRVPSGDETVSTHSNGKGQTGDKGIYGTFENQQGSPEREGRFPANFIHDGSKEVTNNFPYTKTSKRGEHLKNTRKISNSYRLMEDSIYPEGSTYGDEGSAARFFYSAKVSKKERNAGLDDIEATQMTGRDPGQDELNVAFKLRPTTQKNNHPTVKPVALMAYLCRLVTPKGGMILDPFMGSGSTGMAAKQEGFSFTGIDLDQDYVDISTNRIKHWNEEL